MRAFGAGIKIASQAARLTCAAPSDFWMPQLDLEFVFYAENQRRKLINRPISFAAMLARGKDGKK